MRQVTPLAPFIISTIGAASDYATTRIGLMHGLTETHPLYNPVYALIVFWSLLAVAKLYLPKETLWQRTILGIACFSFLGAFNNALLLGGLR
jgi:hypothetical protein